MGRDAFSEAFVAVSTTIHLVLFYTEFILTKPLLDERMSSSESDFECSYDSQDSDIPDYEIEDEEPQQATSSRYSFDEVEFGYAEEPLAHEEWLAQYQEEVKNQEELDLRLKNRFDGTERISEW